MRARQVIRLSNQQALLYPDRSTFSVHEVPVAGQPAYSYYALYFILEGFLPSKAGEPIEEPEIELEEILRFRFPSGS